MSYKSQFRKQANQRLERNIPPVGRMFPKLPHTGSLYLTLKYLWQEQQVRWVVGLYCGPKKMIIFFFLRSNCIPDVLLHLECNSQHAGHDTGEPL